MKYKDIIALFTFLASAQKGLDIYGAEVHIAEYEKDGKDLLADARAYNKKWRTNNEKGR
jgi:hypothetical protein